jgi:hypothetical protein
MIFDRSSGAPEGDGGRAVRLVEEPLLAAGAPLPPVILELPAGSSWLALSDAGVPFLSVEPSANDDASLLLEPVFPPRRPPRVLLLAATPGQVSVNARRAGRLSVLSERDQFRLNGSSLFHVTLFTRPRVGPPSEALLGRECPVCRVPFASDTTAFHCACGGGLHLVGAEQNDDLLQCARAVSACPRCSQPIVLKEGYSWFPPEVRHA